MSSLEKRIEQWRVELAASETLANADIGELEAHLREEMDTLKTSDLSEDEAFLVARHRLGQTATLSTEFAKINGSQRIIRHLWWMMAGVLAYILGTHFAGAASAGSLAATELTHLTPHIRGLIAVAARIGAFCAVGGLVLWLCVRFSVPEGQRHIGVSKRMRLAFVLTLVLEALGFAALRMLAIPFAVRTAGIEEYGGIVMIESVGAFVWKLLAPILLATILVQTHIALKRRARTS